MSQQIVQEDDQEEWPDGELQLQIGRAMPLLQDVSNFAQRCNAVILNAVHQLCALYDAASTHLFALWRNVHLVPVFKQMGLLLATLQTIDAIVRDNEVLQEAWQAYKKLVVSSATAAAATEGGEGGSEPDRSLERMVAALDFSVLAGALYSNCVGQYFDVAAEGAPPGTPPMQVSRNAAFQNEMATALSLLLDQSLARIGRDGEQDERLQLVGALSLFGLSRSILPPTAPPDVELYKKLWRTQESVVVVPLYGRAVWLADEFLEKHGRMEAAVPPKKLIPRAPAAFRKAACNQLDQALPTIAKNLAFKVHTWVGQFTSAWQDASLGPPPSSDGAPSSSPFGTSSSSGGSGGGGSGPRRRAAADAGRGENVSHVTGNPITAASNQEVDSLLDVRLSLLQHGSSLAAAAQRNLTTFLALHDVTETACPTAAMHAAVQIACLQKIIESTLVGAKVQVAAFVPVMVRRAALPVLRAINRAELAAKTAEKERRMTAHMSMQMTALHLMKDLFTGTETWTAARMAALQIAARVGTGPGNVKSKAQLLPEGGADRISRCVWTIEISQTSFTQALANCNSRILYWHRHLLPSIVQGMAMASQGGFKSGRLQYMLSALSDACMMLTKTVHEVPVGGSDDEMMGGATAGAGKTGSRYERLYTYYCDWLLHTLQDQVVQPAARAVQLQLRLQAYVVAANATVKTPPNPRKLLEGAAGGGAEQISEATVRALPGLLRLPPLAVGRTRVHIASAVASLLEEDFYKLTVVAPHDWRLYAQMAALARTHYGLSILDPHLPSGVVDSGLDVLQIMRNIKVFCNRFNYNMNTQTFIERKPEQSSKHMHSVNVHSITASIRQHGAGMLNTTVNFAYQFLSKYLRIFSRSLQDENIKSYLSRERRWFKKNRKTLKGRYPFEHAEKFSKEVQKWGMIDKNTSFLDKLREHVAQMGNALGYVRMVRTAGMNQASSAAQFLPDLDRIIDFEAAAKNVAEAIAEMLIGEPLPDPAAAGKKRGQEESKADEGGLKSLSDDTVDAAKALNSVIKDVTDKFTSSADYLRILKDAFRSAADKVEAATAAAAADGTSGSQSVARENHLRNFFLMIPGMTLSFVKALRSSRDQLDKVHKGRTAYFTDDGFAMGVAFLLSVFRQDKMFDALHWFDSVRDQHRQELRHIQAALQAAPTRGKEAKQHIEELQFKERRLHNVQREYDCIEYALSGARIFFRDEHKALQTKYGGAGGSKTPTDGSTPDANAGAAASAESAPAQAEAAPAAGAGAAAPPAVNTTAPAPPSGTPPPAATPAAAAAPPSTTPSGDPTAATPAAATPVAAAPAPAAVPAAYKRYDMLRKMGMPDHQLGLKMQAEGMDPSVLGIDMSSTALAVVE